MQKDGFKAVLDRLKNPSDLVTWAEKPTMSFQKILWSDKQFTSCHSEEPKNLRTDRSFASAQDDKKTADGKIAFVGLTDCDAKALRVFLKQFEKTNIMPKRSDILIVTIECKPDKNCFCQALEGNNFDNSDLHIQENGKDYEIFALTKLGKKVLKLCGIEKIDKNIAIRPIKNQNVEKLNLTEISHKIDNKVDNLEYWQQIAGQCFGCGACTAVCPLCFCFRQDIQNDPDGGCTKCISVDSCYSESFSETSGHHNARPTNADRMYNWYHHKFCRSVKQNNYPLCTGCGRCITTCPANLNQFRIVSSVTKQEKTNGK